MRRCTPHRGTESNPVGDWLIGLGCVLALVVAVAVGNGATIAVGKNPLRPDRVLTNAITPQGDADYVEGLARLGIVRLPCFPCAVAQLDPTRALDMRADARPEPSWHTKGGRWMPASADLRCSRDCQGRRSHLDSPT
jgi:hypothetical protein